MFPSLSEIKIPDHGSHVYFFYGVASEPVLPGLIANAEKLGCEFLTIVPMQMQVQPSNLSLYGSQAQPQLVTIYRLYVRCVRTEFPAIKEAMEKEAKEEAMKKSLNGKGSR